ncbi:MAG: DMT family transporter [Anaerolineales bacterium]
MKKKNTGVWAAVSSAVFLGLAPVLGKKAISLNFSYLQVAAFRTLIAALLLFIVLAIFRRQYLYIYPAGLIGCSIAGAINGVGSLFYYASLEHINASLGQLLYSLYPFFLAVWMALDAQPLSKLSILRIGMALAALFLLLYNTNGAEINYLGVIFMLIGALFYAIHLPINQKVLYDVPAPTVTLYTLIAMSAVVVPAFLILDFSLPYHASWDPIIWLALATFFSRILLFMGVKHLGGMQTALLGLLELLISIGLSITWLHETLTLTQWLGAGILCLTILLAVKEPPDSGKRYPGRISWLSWLRPPDLN